MVPRLPPGNSSEAGDAAGVSGAGSSIALLQEPFVSRVRTKPARPDAGLSVNGFPARAQAQSPPGDFKVPACRRLFSPPSCRSRTFPAASRPGGQLRPSPSARSSLPSSRWAAPPFCLAASSSSRGPAEDRPLAPRLFSRLPRHFLPFQNRCAAASGGFAAAEKLFPILQGALPAFRSLFDRLQATPGQLPGEVQDVSLRQGSTTFPDTLPAAFNPRSPLS